MPAEFAAAAVVLSEAIAEFRGGDMDVDIDGLKTKGNEGDVVLSKVKVKVNDIISQSYLEVMDYYLYYVVTSHKHFLWTSPPLTILPRSKACDSILQLLTSEGKKLYHPMRPKSTMPDATPPPPPPVASKSSLPAATTKRQVGTNGDNLEAKKQ
jgi:hypothetical protein